MVCTGSGGFVRTFRSRLGPGVVARGIAEPAEHSFSLSSSAADDGSAEPPAQQHNAITGLSHMAPRNQPKTRWYTMISAYELSVVADGLSNSVRGPRHDQVNAELPEFCAGAAGVSIDAASARWLGAGL